MELSQQSGESILDSLEKNGVKPNNHCRNGYCGMCRMKVSPEDLGNIAMVGEALGFHDHNTEILACVSSLQSGKIDLLIDPPGQSIRLHHETSISLLSDIDVPKLAANIEKKLNQEQASMPAPN